MKILTKIKIFYVVLCIIPIFLMGLAVILISTMGMNAIQEKYGIGRGGGISSYYNPFVMLQNMTETIDKNLEETMEDNPDLLENIGYLEDINSELSKYSSFLVVKKSGEILFLGQNTSNPSEVIDEAYYDMNIEEGNLVILSEHPYHMRQKTFRFGDGSIGEIFIMTNIEQLMPRIQSAAIQVLMVIGLIFVFAGAMFVFWLYRSVIRPVGRLKMAAENIKEGNLNFSIQAEKNDEIGELCTAFEEMRVKLKEQIEISMQYEKDNKELISNISHDLKTPITAIKGYIEGIMDGVFCSRSWTAIP